MEYSALELKALLEPLLTKDLKDKIYTSRTIEARKFLTNVRFDLAFKLLYLEKKEKDLALARQLYTEHIRAFSLGKFVEPGNEKKNNIEKFFQAFEVVFKDIESNGFNHKKTLIPLSNNGLIANGAHRIASAIYLNKNVECVNIDTHDQKYDYKFFYERNVSKQDLDVAATKFVEYADNVYVAFIWPTAQGHDRKIEKIIPNIVYRKEVGLTLNGAHNLLSQIYYGEPWLGSVKNNFSGARVKVMECFKTFDPIRVVVFQSESLEKVFEIKEKIRDTFNVGKHSVHITDTKEEAVRVARVVLNDNSIHFLNHAKPNKYTDFHQQIIQYKRLFSQCQIDTDDLVLGSDATLSIYGIKTSEKMSCLLGSVKQLTYMDEDVTYCGNELEYYSQQQSELVYNPNYHFYFNDLKFVSFEQIYQMKMARNNTTDVGDLELMLPLLNNDQNETIMSRWKQDLYYGRAKLRQVVVNLLKTIGVLDFVKKVIYRR